MNKQRRREIDLIIAKIEDAKIHLENIIQEEQDFLDNMPENMQAGDRGQKSEEAVSNLETALDQLDESVSSLIEAQQ